MTSQRYPSPFSGRPAQVELTSYFLLSPAVVMKLVGMPMRQVWRELGAESIFKTLEYHRKRRQDPPERLAWELLAKIPDPAFRSELTRQLERILKGPEQGEADAEEELVQYTPWAFFLQGLYRGDPEGEYPYPSRYILSLERALAEPAGLIRENCFTEAARAIVSDPLLRPLLSPEMRSALEKVPSAKRLGPVAWAVTLETSLAQLAAWGATGSDELEGVRGGPLEPLLPDGGADEATPAQRFYRFLSNALGATSFLDMADRLNKKGVSVEVRTLERWSAGETVPARNLIRIIANRLCPERAEQVLELYDATRYLTLLGYVSVTYLREMDKVRRMASGDDLLLVKEAFAPWPDFPFGAKTFTAWYGRRYPFWFDYHRRRLEAGLG